MTTIKSRLNSAFFILIAILLFAPAFTQATVVNGEEHTLECGTPTLVVMLEYRDVKFKKDYDGIKSNDYWYDIFFNKVNNYYNASFSDKPLQLKPLDKKNPLVYVSLDKNHPGKTISLYDTNPRTDLTYDIDFDIKNAVSKLVTGCADANDLIVYVVVAGYEQAGSYDVTRLSTTQAQTFIPEWVSIGTSYKRAVVVKDDNIISWAVSGELLRIIDKNDLITERPVTLGIVAHEILHLYGLPDLDVINGGDYSLMGTGMWGLHNSTIANGTAPAGLSAPMRYILGDGYRGQLSKTNINRLSYNSYMNVNPKYDSNFYLVELYKNSTSITGDKCESFSVIVYKVSKNGYFIRTELEHIGRTISFSKYDILNNIPICNGVTVNVIVDEITKSWTIKYVQ